MPQPKAVDGPWTRRLARPVRRVQATALVVLVICVLLLIAATAWLVTGILSGDLQLALWQQALLVLGLIGLVALAGLAFRIAFFARLVRGFLD